MTGRGPVGGAANGSQGRHSNGVSLCGTAIVCDNHGRLNSVDRGAS